ncbi:GSCFA domain-containing protein [Algoriphagus sp. CAU 1675]|uniref:GSCFA domain-containing protein n=1 Tax=Algoriphagus sp. CAU 1675 TaxID=3032597 RepID=UPI0023DC0D16|nr:GSCFA domain-containing protein [Algoriphagus sp. CAU 1675]MDF2158569.1 GSCFA domain-containing protein [Algoriphagus sp. CAU 1675]
MQWFTEFEIPQSPFPISHQSKVLSMGSCFAQSMGEKMEEHKFDIFINPFGTIFHPLALRDLLDLAIRRNPIDEKLILERDETYFHYLAHSDLFGKSEAELLEKFSHQLEITREYLSKGSHLILTFGTSWIYELQENIRVANCHKQPQKIFRKRLTGLEEMENTMAELLKQLTGSNPKLKVILTVSPVRHIKDGIPENQLSKSLLRVLCSKLEEQFSFVNYFPSYEIMMDELRDYRFYKSDRIHPTEEAESYIWKKWKSSFFSTATQETIGKISKIQRELVHRPLNPESPSHLKFLQNLLQKLERLNEEFDFSKEIKFVSESLNPPNLP